MNSYSNSLHVLLEQLGPQLRQPAQALMQRLSGQYSEEYLPHACMYMSACSEGVHVTLQQLLAEVDDNEQCLTAVSSIVAQEAPKFLSAWEQAAEDFRRSYAEYRRFQEQWVELDLRERKNHSGDAAVLKDIAWLLTNTVDLADPLPKILGYVVRHLPGAFECSNGEALTEDYENVVYAIGKVKSQGLRGLSSDPQVLEGLLSACNTHYNLQKLVSIYRARLQPWQFDRTAFTKKDQVMAPVKPETKVQSAQLKSRRMLVWGQQSVGQVRMPMTSPIRCPDAPMSLTLEMTSWFRRLLDSESPACMELIEHVADQVGTLSDQSELFFKLYAKAAASLPRQADHPSFYEAVLATAVECVNYFHGLNLELLAILSACKVSVVEFWQVCTEFSSFDPKFPVTLRRHLKEVEMTLLRTLAWDPRSSVLQEITSSLEEFMPDVPDETDNAPSLEQPLCPSLDAFFKRVCSYAAYLVMELGDALELTEESRELAWDAMKYIFNEHIEVLEQRHMDSVVICAVYAACKLKESIKFKIIVNKYTQLELSDPQAYSDVWSGGDVISFYNAVFVPTVKEFLVGARKQTRSAVLSQHSPLRENCTQYAPLRSPRASPRSPYMTPKTRKLCADRDSPFVTIPPTSHPSSSRLIKFDEAS